MDIHAVAAIVTPPLLSSSPLSACGPGAVQLVACQCCDFAGESEMAQQIAAVWRDLDIENRVRGKKITDRRADFCIWRQNQQAGRIFAETELDWATKHSFATRRRAVCFFEFQFRSAASRPERQRNLVADFVIRRAANDLPFRSTAIIDFANGQAIGVRMLRRSRDLRNDHLVDLCAARFDPFGFDAGARNNSAISSGFFGRSTNSRSQLTENFILLSSRTK